MMFHFRFTGQPVEQKSKKQKRLYAVFFVCNLFAAIR